MTTATMTDLSFLQALAGAGDKGFAPLGWMYGSVMADLTMRGLACSDGTRTYRLSDHGRLELARLEDERGRGK